MLEWKFIGGSCRLAVRHGQATAVVLFHDKGRYSKQGLWKPRARLSSTRFGDRVSGFWLGARKGDPWAQLLILSSHQMRILVA